MGRLGLVWIQIQFTPLIAIGIDVAFGMRQISTHILTPLLVEAGRVGWVVAQDCQLSGESTEHSQPGATRLPARVRGYSLGEQRAPYVYARRGLLNIVDRLLSRWTGPTGGREVRDRGRLCILSEHCRSLWFELG